MRSFISVVFAAVLLVGTAGCDTTPGTSPVDQATPPRVSGLTVTPENVQFEDVAGTSQTATFTLTASENLEGAASEVRFIAQPFASFDPAGETVATPEGAGRGENLPPSVDEVVGPMTFTPPGILRFEVMASDPDGPNDLLKVQVGAGSGQLFNLTAQREGFYTVGFDIPEVEPGPEVFTFFATDRAGDESAPVEFIVTFE